MEINKIEYGSFFSNTYIITSKNRSSAIIIDPSTVSLELGNAIKNLNVKYIINTHGHFDHIGGNSFIKSKKNSLIIIHALDAAMLNNPAKNLSLFTGNPIVSEPPDIQIRDEDYCIDLEELSFRVIFVPGHTMGSIALYQKENNSLISGDFIFPDSIGRTDFPGSSFEKMKESIRKIVSLPDETVVYPGHEEVFILKDFKEIYRNFI